MNQTEIIEIIQTQQRIKEIKEEKDKLEHLLNCASAFQNFESKVAFNHIQEYVIKKEDEIAQLELKINKIKEKLSQNCTHSILLPGNCSYDFECPFCKSIFNEKEFPSGVRYFVAHDMKSWKRVSDINKLVCQSKDEWEATKSILDYYEVIQYEEEEDVVIRRLEL